MKTIKVTNLRKASWGGYYADTEQEVSFPNGLSFKKGSRVFCGVEGEDNLALPDENGMVLVGADDEQGIFSISE